MLRRQLAVDPSCPVVIAKLVVTLMLLMLVRWEPKIKKKKTERYERAEICIFIVKIQV